MFEACGQSQQALDVLSAASNAALPLTTDLYNAVLRCCIPEQHGERAIEVWEEMQVRQLGSDMMQACSDSRHVCIPLSSQYRAQLL